MLGQSNGERINIGKTEVFLFLKQKDTPGSNELEVNEQKLSNTPKLFGVILDEALNFLTHITRTESQQGNKHIKTSQIGRKHKHTETNTVIQGIGTSSH